MDTNIPPGPRVSDKPRAKPPAPGERLPYEPPKVTFVPLRIEERLLACSKFGTCLADQS